MDDDDDDYDPDFSNAEDTEQIMNKLDNAPPESEEPVARAPEVALGPFTLPPPPPHNTRTSNTNRASPQSLGSSEILQTLEEHGKKLKLSLD